MSQSGNCGNVHLSSKFDESHLLPRCSASLSFITSARKTGHAPQAWSCLLRATMLHVDLCTSTRHERANLPGIWKTKNCPQSAVYIHIACSQDGRCTHWSQLLLCHYCHMLSSVSNQVSPVCVLSLLPRWRACHPQNGPLLRIWIVLEGRLCVFCTVCMLVDRACVVISSKETSCIDLDAISSFFFLVISTDSAHPVALRQVLLWLM
jgi:hypothetical protein